MSFRNERLENMLFPNKITRLIGRIHEYKGKQDLFKKQTPEVLEALKRVAMIQSAESSNRIEGIVVSEKRIESLVQDKAEPKNRSEAEVAGYRDVLETIHTSFEYMSVKPSLILQFHRDLMKLATGSGGKWKVSDNEIRETLPTGEVRIRFVPVPAWQTPEAVEELTNQFKEKRESGYVDDLVLIAAFVLDFLSIHPFGDGNGRMARLLTLLLLYQSGYEVGRYISLEKVIEETKEQYYETLYMSSQNWHEGEHHLLSWIEYFLTVVLKAYQRFEERVGTVTDSQKGWKKERIETVIKSLKGEFTIADIEELCPGISRPTISRTLNEMSRKHVITCTERGRNAKWVKVEDLMEYIDLTKQKDQS